MILFLVFWEKESSLNEKSYMWSTFFILQIQSYAESTLLVIFLSYGNLGYFLLSMLPT